MASGIPTDPNAPRLHAADPARLDPGRVIAGRYEIRARLGSGGMGVVYRAFDRDLGETIALKVLHPARLGDPAAVERFRREVRLSRRITHPNVCRVFDVGEDGDLHFLTMEIVEGRPLRALLDEAPIAPGRALDLVAQIARGVAAAHRQGIVHRDLKPENVLVEGAGLAKVADFGLASGAAGDGSTMAGAGTPPYMSPEQLRGEPLGTESDVFSLALVAQETLTRRHPFGEGQPAVVTSAILRDPPRPVEAALPAEIAGPAAEILGAALAKRPEDRPAAAEIAEVFEALGGAPVPSARVPPVSVRRPAATASSTGPSTQVAAPAEVRPIHGARRAVVAMGALAAAVAAGAVAFATRRGPEVSDAVTVAVTPFADLAGTPDLARAAEGNVRAGLRAVAGITVVDAPPATWTADGSAQRTGPMVRLSLQIEGGRPEARAPYDVEGPKDAPGPMLDALRARAADEARLLIQYRARRLRAERETESAAARAKVLAYFDRTRLVPAQADVEIGMRLLDEALAIDPAYPVARTARAELFILRSAAAREPAADIAAARADLDAALSARPSDARALALRCSLAHFELMLAGAADGDRIDAAFAACTRAVEADPTGALPRRVLAKLHDLACDDARAVEELKQVVSADRARAGDALGHMVELLLASGSAEAADAPSAALAAMRDEDRRLGDRSIARLAGTAPARGAYLLRGIVLLRLGRGAEARRAFVREIEDAPDSGVVSEAAARRALLRLDGAPPDSDPRLREIEAGFHEAVAGNPRAAITIAGAYRWTDPEAALAWMDTLDLPATCGDAVRYAAVLHGAGDDAGGRRALAACVPRTPWEQRCLEVMEAQVGAAP